MNKRKTKIIAVAAMVLICASATVLICSATGAFRMPVADIATDQGAEVVPTEADHDAWLVEPWNGGVQNAQPAPVGPNAAASGAGASVAYGEVSEYACSAEIPFDKNNPATWFCAAQNGGIGEDQAEKLEVGMTFTEAVALLGRPQRDIGSGSMLAEWDMQSGKVLTVCFRPSGTDADATISYRILIRG